MVKATGFGPQVQLAKCVRTFGIFLGLRHFSCLIFVSRVLRHYLEDDEDNEIGFRARDCRAIRSVPWEPLGGIGGGEGNPLGSGLRRSFQIAT
jgi:hypothetical protein